MEGSSRGFSRGIVNKASNKHIAPAVTPRVMPTMSPVPIEGLELPEGPDKVLWLGSGFDIVEVGTSTRQLVSLPWITKKGVDPAEIPNAAEVSNAFAIYHPSITSTDVQIKLSALDRAFVVRIRIVAGDPDGKLLEVAVEVDCDILC